MNVPDGLIHDWVGAAFLPGVTVEQTLALVQDYDRHKQVYRPEVVDSRILSHDGNHFRVFLRLLKKKVITVVLDTDHDVHYERLDAHRWRSVSRTSRISEVRERGRGKREGSAAGHGAGLPVEAEFVLAV